MTRDKLIAYLKKQIQKNQKQISSHFTNAQNFVAGAGSEQMIEYHLNAAYRAVEKEAYHTELLKLFMESDLDAIKNME